MGNSSCHSLIIPEIQRVIDRSILAGVQIFPPRDLASIGIEESPLLPFGTVDEEGNDVSADLGDAMPDVLFSEGDAEALALLPRGSMIVADDLGVHIGPSLDVGASEDDGEEPPRMVVHERVAILRDDLVDSH